MRKADRFKAAEQAMIITRDGAESFRVTDISVTGAGLVGKAPALPGATVLVRLSSCTVKASVARIGSGFFGLRFEDTLATRVALVRHIYSGRYLQVLSDIRPTRVIRAVSGRLFG